MAGPYAYTPHIWPPLAAAVLLAALAWYSWRRRNDLPAARPLAFATLFAAIMMLFTACEVAAVAPSTTLAWYQARGVAVLVSATAIMFFVLEYVYPGRWLTRRNLALFALPLLLYILTLVVFGPHVYWRRLEVAPDGSILMSPGMGSMIVVAYALGLGLVNLAALLWLFVRSPQHRWPVALMICGLLTNRILYAVGFSGLSPLTPTGANIIATPISAILYAVAVFGFRILDPLPSARSVATRQMREAMIVLDVQGRVVSANPAAASLLSVPAEHARGKMLQEVLPSLPVLDDHASTDVTLGSEPVARCYAVNVSPLRDFRGQSIGRLLLFLDVTDQRRAEAQRLERQRTLAVIRERERLARELHDDLGQVLAFVNTQGQTARRLMARGEIAAADAQVARLVEVAQEADTDIRESILGLRVALPEQGFFPALATYLEQYEKRYAIGTELNCPPTLGDDLFEPAVEVQLLRIIQEALTNARKHARARSVSVTFAAQDGCAQVAVQDDGCGFEPQDIFDAAPGHVGLRVMRERAEEIGGEFAVHSSVGQGTQIVVTVPLVVGASHSSGPYTASQRKG